MTEVPLPKEIGKTEKDAFRTKITALIRSPKPIGELATHDWFSSYQKGNKSVYLLMPEPGHVSEDSQADCFAAAVRTPLYTVEGKYFVFKEEEIKFHPNFNSEQGGDFSYQEETIIYDKEGQRVPLESPDVRRAKSWEEIDDPVYVRAKLEELKKRFADEEALGTRVVTPERYYSMMSVLNSLTPEDEIV